MAEATKRVRIGCLVTGNTYRNPALLAKEAVTVDHLSGGRLEFGIGAAWAEIEHQMYGFEGLDHRVGRLSESLRIIKSLWTEERTNFDGRYYHMKDAIANPKPLQKPHPPIWIGASGETTMRLVARYADVWNAAGGDLARTKELIEKLEQGVRRDRPRRLRDPPFGPVRLGREERRRARRTVGRVPRARHHRAGDLPARSWSRAGGSRGEARGIAAGPAPQSERRIQHTQEVAMADSVYRVTELVGTSSTSWEAAAKSAIETAAKSLRDLRVAEVVRQDVTIENGKVSTYRVRLNVSFKYEGAPTTRRRK